MGLLLSVLITCVGVLEVIACYTHFRIGTAYNECKSNIRDIAKYYAVELRKHELHFEPGPDDGGPSTSQETLSELMAKRTVRTQEKPQHNQTMTDQDIVKLHSNGHIVNAATSCSDTPEQGTPNLAANLKVPRNSVCGLDSPTVQKLISSEVDITDAIVEKIQSLESNKWIRKSPSPYPDKTGLEVVEKDFWRSRSPSPFPESKDSDSGVEMIYTPGLRKTRDVSPVLETPDIPEIVDIDLDDSSVYSKTDLEVQNITESIMRSEIPRQASPYPETLFGITADTAETEETKFDEAFLRSLDGVNKSSKCDDRRRSFKKKRNSSSTSSRASRDEISRSMTSLDEIDLIDKKPEGELKKISPLTEEETEIISQEVNGHEIRTETVIPEKCESIVSPTPEQSIDKNKGAATVTKQEETLFEAKVSPNTSQESSKPDKGKANLAFTEKVKDLEISVQLLVTVKGTSQGDKMEYTTTVTQDDQKPNPQKALDVKEETVTKTTEEKSEFGNVKTSVTYGSSIQEPEEVKVEEKPNLKDLQISSQSLIHAERTVQDDVASSEAEFLKLYETFTELPDKEKDKFLQKIGQSSKSFEDHVENSNTEINLENPPAENIKMVPKIEPVIEKQNQPKSSTEEKILITEITEITESTESVITIPPEIPTDKKEATKNIIETTDAKLTEISTSDKNVDNSAEVVSSTKECDQNVIENENKHVAIIESNVTQNQVNNSENIPNEKQIMPEPSIIENLETVNVSQQINTQNLEQTNDVNIDKPEKQIITETNIIPTETQTKSESKIINTTTIKQKTSVPENENVFVENESVNIDTRTKDNQVSEITIEKTKTSVNTETDIPLNQITEKQIIEKSSKSEEKTEQNACSLKDKTITTIESEEIKKESSKSKEETKQVTNNLEEKIITTMETEVPVKQIIKVQSKSEEEPKQAVKNVEEETITTVTEKDVETISNNENTSTKTSQTNDESKKSTEIEKSSPEAPKAESSSDSSSTPSTVLENPLRRASKTAFEDATPVQNQEMMKRRVSTSEISPKQASQAFWLIFSAEYTNAMEKDWHGQHFSCWQCDESLTGQRYVLRDDHPYCVKCYEQVFANPCEKCSRIIGIDSKDLSYKDKHWHEACFQCTTCNESLVDKQFGAKGEKIYCGNCYDKQFASRCDGCSKIFHAGTKKMEYKNRQWHEQCFKCCKCETPIGTKSFIPREKDIYCAGCYEEKFATRCVKCDKAIQSGGVTYKNEPWHRECFTCTHCNKNLAGQRFTSRDDKPCCAECFGRLFAKRCTSCAEPITGIGGTRFISFEDRHWHNDCFICATCSTSLVGRGFITDEDKIICPECAKERFM